MKTLIGAFHYSFSRGNNALTGVDRGEVVVCRSKPAKRPTQQIVGQVAIRSSCRQNARCPPPRRLGMMHDAVSMIGWRIEGIEFQRCIAGVDDVVVRSGRNEHREARVDGFPNAVEDRLAGPFFDSKELIELVDFRTDLFTGLKAITTS